MHIEGHSAVSRPPVGDVEQKEHTHTTYCIYYRGKGIDGDSLPMWCTGRIEATGRRHRLRHSTHSAYTVYTIAERGSTATPSPCGTSAELRPPVGDTGSGTHPTHLILYILSRKGIDGDSLSMWCIGRIEATGRNKIKDTHPHAIRISLGYPRPHRVPLPPLVGRPMLLVPTPKLTTGRRPDSTHSRREC